MLISAPSTTRQLRSRITRDGELELSLLRVDVPVPSAEEVLVRVEAAPLNPSDLGLLFGAADMRPPRCTGNIRLTAPPGLLR